MRDTEIADSLANQSRWIALIALMGNLSLLPALGLASDIGEEVQCATVEGLSDAVEANKPRFVIFGEMHGTSEIPRLFGDAVCQLSASKAILVALEFESQEGQNLNTYIKGAGPSTAGRIITTGSWADPERDGRTSKAMFSMITRLRQLRRAGRRIEIVGVVPPEVSDLPQNYYELGIANELRRAAISRPEATIVVLIGNIHARKVALGALRPAASLLPPDDVLSLINEATGGNAWNCQADGCSPHPMTASSVRSRGVIINPAARDGYDGSFSVGRPYSASAPMTTAP
jgi:hypothetical protein